MDRWMDGKMDGWIHRWVDGGMDRWMGRWVDGWMDVWMDGGTVACMHVLIHVLRLILFVIGGLLGFCILDSGWMDRRTDGRTDG